MIQAERHVLPEKNFNTFQNCKFKKSHLSVFLVEIRKGWQPRLSDNLTCVHCAIIRQDEAPSPHRPADLI